MDKIDLLIACLNEHMPDVPFDRDAINVDRPTERWGAAELRRQVAGQWADGHLIDQALGVDLYLCVDDRESAWLADVQDALNEFSDAEDIGYGFAERVYLPAIDRALWRWGISFYGGLEVPEPEAEDDGTGTETGEE